MNLTLHWIRTIIAKNIFTELEEVLVLWKAMYIFIYNPTEKAEMHENLVKNEC